MNRRSLIYIAAILAAIAVLLAVSGGVRATVGGLRISVRSPIPISTAALALVGVWWILARGARSIQPDLVEAWSALARRSSRVVVAIAAVSAVTAGVFATHSAAGADASGYLSEAAQWSAGELFYRDALPGAIGAADPWITAPLGWRPTGTTGVQAPTYPPGLPLLMAIPHALGGTMAASLVIAAGAGIAVWATAAVAAQLAGGIAGVLAAALLAVTPVFLYQSVQPMSDVPVTAAWMVMWLLLVRGSGRVLLAGLCCAIAVLIRPNLAPLAAVPLMVIGFHRRRLVAFSLPVAVAGLALMWLQWQWYGSPLRSGYGTADELFAFVNIAPNATRYLSWLVATSPVLLIAPAGVAVAWRQAPAKALAAFATLVVAAYLVYAVFEVWSYLRFLLPALAVAAVFTSVAVASAIARLPASSMAAAVLAVVLGLMAHGVSQARALDAFRLADQQRRVSQVADYLAGMSADAVIVAGEQSGALRYYSGRSILRWDAASPDALARAIGTLATGGRPIVIALDAWENEPFRAKLGALPAVSLEWPPAFEAGTSHRTRVWRLSDRDAFLRGERVNTDRVP
ncbi:MAG: hypothetical protein WC815_16065 [Vicinamibacterales bacterium]